MAMIAGAPGRAPGRGQDAGGAALLREPGPRCAARRHGGRRGPRRPRLGDDDVGLARPSGRPLPADAPRHPDPPHRARPRRRPRPGAALPPRGRGVGPRPGRGGRLRPGAGGRPGAGRPRALQAGGRAAAAHEPDAPSRGDPRGGPGLRGGDGGRARSSTRPRPPSGRWPASRGACAASETWRGSRGLLAGAVPPTPARLEAAILDIKLGPKEAR